MRGFPLGVDLGCDGLHGKAQRVKVDGDAGKAGSGGFGHGIVAFAFHQFAGSRCVEHVTAVLTGTEVQVTGFHTGNNHIYAFLGYAELLSGLRSGRSGHKQLRGHVVNAFAAGNGNGSKAFQDLGHAAFGGFHRPDESTALVGLDAGLAGNGIDLGMREGELGKGALVALTNVHGA